MTNLFILMTVLLLAYPNAMNAKGKNKEAETISKVNSSNTETFKIDGEMKIPLYTNGEVGGFIFSGSGNITLINENTGIKYNLSYGRFEYIIDGPKWNMTAIGKGTLNVTMAAYYNGTFYQEGETVWIKTDENGNITEKAVVKNGAIVIYPWPF